MINLKEFTENQMEKMDIVSIKIIEEKFKDSKNVNFSCVKKFLDTEKEGIGRGDQNEGLIARLHKIDDKDRIKDYETIYDDLIKTENSDFVELRRLSGLYTPIYCIYTMNDNLLKKIERSEKEQKIFITYEIPEKFFYDFCGAEKVGILNLNNTKAVSNILDQSIKNNAFLKKNNVKLSVKPIIYTSLDIGRWECPKYLLREKVDFNYELLYKDEQFYYQHEVRFILESKAALLKEERLNFLVEMDESFQMLYLGKIENGIKLKLEISVQIIEDI